MRRGWTAGLPGVLALALAGTGSLPSRAWAAEQVQAAEQGHAGVTPHAAARPTKRSPLERRVATLTRALDLDAKQQDALRRVLERQREQMLRVWRDGSTPSADRIVATKAVGRQTANLIRALLNEEQRKKYDPPPQGDSGGTVGRARVEDWMKGGSMR